MIAALLLAATSAPAADPACTAPAPLTRPWTGWTHSGQAQAGVQVQGAPALTLGQPVTATLAPAANVRFAATPGKGAAEGHGGLFTLSLRQAGRIGIGLDGPAWVDVVTGTVAQTSVEHGHGPACSGIRKIVWFDLKPGRHVVQIAGSQSVTARIMAVDARAGR